MSSLADQAVAHDADGDAPAHQAGPLEQRLREIAGGADAPEDALEPALQALCEATGIGAAALCLYDAQQEVLRLTTDIGLSDEGCRYLRSVRQGAGATWDVPLRSLTSRRAFLLDRSPALPPLVDAMASVTTVACVPVCAGATPIASLVLVALAPRVIEERDIRDLDGPLRELVRIVDAARRPRVPKVAAAARPAVPMAISADYERLRGEVAVRLAERASLAAQLAARTEELERLRTAIDAATGERARLAAELEQARRDGERAESLATSLAASERERAALAEALQVAAAEHAEQLRAQLSAVERAEHARAESEIERCRAESERLIASIRAGHEDECARLRGRVREAEQALEQHRVGGESARAEAAGHQAELEAATHRMTAEVQRLEEAQRADRTERERLERELAIAHATATSEQTAREELAREVAAMREAHDRAATMSREGAAATGALRTQLDQLAVDSSYKGTNLLQSGTLTVSFNEDGSSSITLTGFDADTSGLPIAAAANTWQLDANIDAATTELDAALTSLRTQAATLSSNNGVMTTRQAFITNMVNTLSEGASNLTAADSNEEGANMLALQTRQQLGMVALQLSSQAQQSILRLFG